MGYQMQEILKKCTKDDVQFIIETIDSYINFSDDSGLKTAFACWETNSAMPDALAKKLETEIRYIASNDVAYFLRKTRGLEPAGIEVDEIINDITQILKIKVKPVGSTEGKLESLVKSVVEKKILTMTPEEQIRVLQDAKIEEAKIQEIMNGLKDNTKRVFAVFAQALGKTGAFDMIATIAGGVMATFIGKEAASKILLIVASRTTLIPLGAILGVASLGWVGLELCGAASRKTIPIMLSLGLVALRDGPEKEVDFFGESSGQEA
ncbi:hypothetical protein LJC46_07545 [Desulfovibrio sp. OttesenSCG-928-G15]|nr:hypothetical protein [Desulfovibrio sp. OttesenSCG-928-G15]